MARSGTVTILFTDLVNSTVHLQEAGDEAGARIFQAHHKLLSAAISANGGEELQWLGDGILASFSSSADAVRCAISIEQASRRPQAGMRLEVRIGIHVGEVLQREGGYFGTPLVVARRLCDRASSGQILCSRLVADMLSARQAFSFHDLGPFELKGLATPMAVCEIVYEHNDPAAMLSHTPFVGRAPQLERLSAKLADASNGRGSVLMIRGEAGIGKTRILEEFAHLAVEHGATVMHGACYDGEFQPPYSPFAGAIAEYARSAGVAALGKGVAILARMVPSLRGAVGQAPEAEPLAKDEERFQLLDAVSQFLINLSRQAPLVLILDDLHWADRGVAAMLRHVAHFVPENSILLIGAYRDAEVDRRHPIATALAGISRLANFETLSLSGLKTEELADLLETIGDQDAPSALITALQDATDGNPLFIRELLLHLVEGGKILRDGQSWISRFSVEELGIPEGVRQVIGSRLQRLSEDANQLLSVASAFKGAFAFGVAASAAGLDEDAALSAIDEALEAQLLRPAHQADSFDFTHAIIRHTLYAGLNPPRRVRLHRKIAEAMETAWGQQVSHHAAEMAYQFWRGASSSGRENRGVEYSIAAADQAEAACAYDEVVAFIRISLELMAPADPRRKALLARLGLALAWTLDGDGACKTAREASELIAAVDGDYAAAVYLEQIVQELYASNLSREAWTIVGEGLRLVGDRHDMIWARLREIDLAREEAEDPNNPGIRVDSEGQREWRALLRQLPREVVKVHGADTRYETRQEIIDDKNPNPASVLLLAGDYKRALPLWQKDAGESESRGRLSWAVTALGNIASCHIALGDFDAARAALSRGAALAARISSLGSGPGVNLNLLSAQHELRVATDEGWMELLQNSGSLDVLNKPAAENNWAFAMIRGAGAYLFARMNQQAMALQWIGTLRNAFEKGAPWEPTYSAVVCDAAAALWMLDNSESASVIEHCIFTKVLPADFRYPMRDARLSMARLCAVQHRFEEASRWFAKARESLEEQGARPLRALADYDEGLMYRRRKGEGDDARAKPLIEKALGQFKAIGMSGWAAQAEASLSEAA